MTRFNIIIALSATLGLSSCDLDMTPMDQVSDAVFWQKPSDFELAANDFYFSLMEASQYIDKNSDIAFGSGADDVSDGSYLAPVNSDDWDEPWKFIQSTSYLLKKAEESGLTDDEIGRWSRGPFLPGLQLLETGQVLRRGSQDRDSLEYLLGTALHASLLPAGDH